MANILPFFFACCALLRWDYSPHGASLCSVAPLNDAWVHWQTQKKAFQVESGRKVESSGCLMMGENLETSWKCSLLYATPVQPESIKIEGRVGRLGLPLVFTPKDLMRCSKRARKRGSGLHTALMRGLRRWERRASEGALWIGVFIWNRL